MSNRLSRESSPYLLQHADNPVDWLAWGPDALTRAREEEKPILLSIGYSSCHWCHVMERESFEDEETAALMNEAFVNVKVDREERPDVDAVYMRAVQALTGRGGWPLTVFLTPGGEPYYGGTYFPPAPRQGMPSFRQVLRAARDAWDARRDDVERAAGEIRTLLQRSAAPREAEELSPALLEGALRSLHGSFDSSRGGFGSAPKFPQPMTLEFLLRRYRATGDERALAMVTTTLKAMARGGIRDHLGGGFHRYSVDARWLVPHFEKMLYDNALLARLYAQAWQVTGDGELREAVEDTVGWLLDDMRSPDGGFYAARDADSEGEEGTYYLWTPEQLADALDPGDAKLAARVWDVTGEGNFEGRNILHTPHGLDGAARALGMEPDELRERLGPIRRRLLEARTLREPPFRDEKVLAGWNGMAFRALAEAGGALGREDWIEAADRGMRWLLQALRPDRPGHSGGGPEGPLLHVWTDGEAKIPAFLEDVAALGNAALTLHETTLDPSWLEEARRLADRCVRDFWEKDAGSFYDVTREGARDLPVRPRESMDNATPAGTSLAAELCLRAGHLFDDPELLEKGRRGLAGEAGAVARHPAGFGRVLSLVQGLHQEPLEVAVVGRRDDPETGRLLRTVLERYLPERTLVGAEPGETLPFRIPLLEGRVPEEAGSPPAAWVCRNYACERPVHESGALARALAPHPSGDRFSSLSDRETR